MTSKIATNGATDHKDWDINDSHFPKLQIVIIQRFILYSVRQQFFFLSLYLSRMNTTSSRIGRTATADSSIRLPPKKVGNTLRVGP